MNNSINFGQLCKNISKIRDTIIKGKCFEYFAQLFFYFDARYSNIIKKCWLLNQVPLKIKQHLGIPDVDIGIDIIIETSSEDFIAVQVKYRSNMNDVISWNELSTFYGLTYGISKKFSKSIFFTNTIDVNKHVRNISNNINILYHFLNETNDNTFSKILGYVNSLKNSDIKILLPRDYQQEIINKAVDYYKSDVNGRLYMPCGTGKSLVSHWIATKIINKKICIVVPSLHLLSQTYNTWVNQSYNAKYLLIGSDAEVKEDDNGLIITTNITEIKKFFDDNDDHNIVVISTYQSSDQLVTVCSENNITVDFCIFDEAHKTVGSKDRVFTCMLNNDKINILKRLFTTATEKVYNGEDDNILSMNNEEIYGKVIYSYSLKKAIEDKQLSDYQIIAPIIADNLFYKMAEKNKLVIDSSISLNSIEIRYYLTAYLILESIKEYKLKHILTFNNTNKNAKIINDIITKMAKQMNINCKTYYMTGETSIKHRKQLIDQFIKDDIAIISSARIFTEGVDIPIIDGVCFVDNKISVIDIIQSVGRCLRLHNDKNKSYIIIPTIINTTENDNSIFNLNPNDFITIKSVLKSMGTIDQRIIEQFSSKDHGKTMNKSNKKFNVVIKNFEENANIAIKVDDLETKINIILCERWGSVNWEENKNILFEYCSEFKCVPTQVTEYKDKKIGAWLSGQKQCIINENSDVYIQLSNNEYVKKSLDDYITFKQENEGTERIEFDEWKNLLFEYCNEYKCTPSQKQLYKNRKIGLWLQNKKNAMKDTNCEIYIKLSENEYIKKSIDKCLGTKDKNKGREKREWNDWKNMLFEYCNEYKRIPTKNTQYKNYKIDQWFQFQKKFIKSTEDEFYTKLSENEYVKVSLDEYLDKKENSKTELIKWNKMKNLLFEYCDENKCIPTNKTNYKNEKIGYWLNHQKQYTKNIDDDIYIKLSENELLKKSFDDYFKNKEKNEDKEKLGWEEWKTLLFEYCDKNITTPTRSTEYKNINIGQWLQDQKKKINNEKDNIYIKLSENEIVKKSLDDYIINKIKNKNKRKLEWDEWKNLLFEYCNENKQIPTNKKEYKDIKIGQWLQDRKFNLIDNKDIIYIKLSENEYVKKSLDDYLENRSKNKK